MRKVALGGGCHFGFLLVGIALAAVGCTLLGLGAGFSASEDAAQTEVVYLVSPAYNHVFRTGFVDLCAGYAKGGHARGLVFHLQRHVVHEGHVQPDEGGEALVQADGTDVEHGAGLVVAGGCVEGVAQFAAASHGGYP